MGNGQEAGQKGSAVGGVRCSRGAHGKRVVLGDPGAGPWRKGQRWRMSMGRGPRSRGAGGAEGRGGEWMH